MVYRSDNAGSTWAIARRGCPKIPMNAVVVDPANFKRVWVAADVGVYQTLDLGASWAAFRRGFRMRWLSTCSFTNRIACSSARRGTAAYG